MTEKHDIAEILPLAAQQCDKRVFRVELDHKFYWVKRCGINDRPWRKKLHKAINYLPLPNWAQLTPYAEGKDAVKRETRKIDAFQQANFRVPKYVFCDDEQIIFLPLENLLAATLKHLRDNDNDKQADQLLCLSAQTLGEAHAAGLCHGRPNPKDMFVENDSIGFFDFEEAPEEVMPLNVAQARDCWLLFMFLADVVSSKDAARQALDAYRHKAPSDVWQPLNKIIRFWHPFAILGRILRGVNTGSEMRRIMKCDAVFFEYLRDLQDTTSNRI